MRSGYGTNEDNKKMEDKPKLTLPEDPKTLKKSHLPGWEFWIVILIIALAQGTSFLFRSLSSPVKEQTTEDNSSFLKELATKLEDRGIFIRAAQTWEKYLEADPKSPRGAISFRIGKLYEQAEEYDKAIEFFYRAEAYGSGGQDVSGRIVNCFRRLGMHSAAGDELENRASLDKSQRNSKGILASLEGEDITEENLDHIISEYINASILQFPPEKRKELLEQLNSYYNRPESRRTLLRQYVAERVLLRKAIEEKLDQKPDVRKQLNSIRDKILAQEFLDREVSSKVTVLEDEIVTYYNNHKNEFSTPSKVIMWIASFPSKEEAEKALDKIQDEEGFQKYVSGDNPKTIEVVKGTDEIPNFGEVKGIGDKLFQGDKVGLVRDVFSTEKGHILLWIKDRTLSIVRQLDQVRDSIQKKIAVEKEKQLQERLINELFQKYGVKFFDKPILEPDKAGEDGKNEKKKP